MPTPSFAQPASRNLALPILIAVLVLGVGAALAYHFIPRSEASATITGVLVHPIKTTFKQEAQNNGFKVMKQKEVSEFDLYIIPTVRIDDHLSIPLFLKDFTVTLTTPDGELHASAIEQSDLPTVYNAFPDIKPLMPTPLLRESSVAPKQSAEGTLLLQFPIPQSTWDTRQSATLTIDFYHQPSLTIPFPKP